MSNIFSRARTIDLCGYLSSIGINPVRENQHVAYYFSPLRSESAPSFMVNKQRNTWIDWGTDDFGDISDLVSRLEGCTTNEAAAMVLKEERPKFQRPDVVIEESPLEILEVRERVEDEVLVEYMEGTRKIPHEVFDPYCKELSFQFRTSPYFTHYGVGFPNDKGGWSIRGIWFKGASRPAAISTLHFENGTEVLLFEGFIDALSYITLYGTPRHTLIVLNSLVFIPMISDILHSYDHVHLYLDNDAAATDKVEYMMANQMSIVDHRGEYAGYNDLNEYLQANFDF